MAQNGSKWKNEKCLLAAYKMIVKAARPLSPLKGDCTAKNVIYLANLWIYFYIFIKIYKRNSQVEKQRNTRY